MTDPQRALSAWEQLRAHLPAHPARTKRTDAVPDAPTESGPPPAVPAAPAPPPAAPPVLVPPPVVPPVPEADPAAPVSSPAPSFDTLRRSIEQRQFLDALAKSHNVSAACKAALVGRSTVYEWRETDAEFAAAWLEALEQAVDLLEGVAWKRATSGGSDRLLILLLRAHRPELYAERVHQDLTTNGHSLTAPITFLVSESPDRPEEQSGAEPVLSEPGPL